MNFMFTVVVLAPGQVENVTLKGVDPNSINVVWLPPQQRNGVIGYVVTAEDLDRKTFVSHVVLKPSEIISGDEAEVGVVLGGLTGNRTYEISVQAFNLKHNYTGMPVFVSQKTPVGRKSCVFFLTFCLQFI